MSAAEWIAKRRELLAAASEGPWFQDADDPGLVWGEQRSDGDGYWSLFASETGHDAAAQPSDAALIADARTSLPRALDALEAVLKAHRPVSFSFSWRDGVAMHEVCPGCQDKAGTHPCGCWRDEDQPHVCAVCSDPEHRMDAPWPCMTVQTIESALGADA